MDRTYLTQINHTAFGTTPTILVVDQDITIGTGSVAFADGCVFEFAGGVIKSGSSSASGEITGSVKVVSNCGLVQLFDHVAVPDMENHEVPIEWFGGTCYANSPNSSAASSDQAMSDALVAHRERKVLFQAGNYVFRNTVAISRSGITLSGTKSFARQWNGFRQTSTDGKNSVSTLAFTGDSCDTFFSISCDGIRMENLLLAGDYGYTAVELLQNCMSFYADRCHFNKWNKGIYKNCSNSDSGLSRCIIGDCTFSYIKRTAIEANVGYVTYNMIRDSWFTLCGCPIKLVSSNQLLQDNSIENCNFDHVRFDSSVYSSCGGCYAIYLESAGTSLTYATNNISRCYFERICYDKEIKDGITYYYCPNSGSKCSAAVICRNCDVTVDNNFFSSTPRLFLIDDCSSITIDDNAIGENPSEANTPNIFPLPHDAIVEVDHSSINKNMTQVIDYKNAIPLIQVSTACFITKLVNFSSDAVKSRFKVRNYHETLLKDNGLHIPKQAVNSKSIRNVSSIAAIYGENTLQVDFDPSRYTNTGSSYDYHSFRLYIYVQYSVYCDVYEVTLNMSNFGGNAKLVNDNIRCIYGATGVLSSQDITIQTKSDPNVTGRFYIYVNTPQMCPTFKFVINSDDIMVADATNVVDFNSIGSTANSITVRRQRGLTSTRPTFNATQSANSKGYEFYDTANSRKTVWNGSRWLTYKAEPEGATASGTTSQRPTSLLTTADKGFTYFDTTLGKPVYWNGSGWVNANGTAS